MRSCSVSTFLIKSTKDLHQDKFLISRMRQIQLFAFIVDKSKHNNSSTCISLGRKDMSKKKEKFNVTQGITLLLLKKISLPANLVFALILFITNPENNIGYDDI